MSTERSIRVQALVLHHTNYGEADRFIRLMTAERGKISALARGVRKMNSRKAGHLEPFTLISTMLSKGKGGLWEVSQVNTLQSFPTLVCQLDATCHAAYVTELADRFSEEDSPNFPLYSLTLETLRLLAMVHDPFPVLRYFDIRLLDLVGYRPQLFQCVSCGEPIQPVPQFFSCAMGGVLCPQCQTTDHFALPISTRTLKYLRHYQRNALHSAIHAGLPEEIRGETEWLINQYLTSLLERKINSHAFLAHIRTVPN